MSLVLPYSTGIITVLCVHNAGKGRKIERERSREIESRRGSPFFPWRRRLRGPQTASGASTLPAAMSLTIPYTVFVHIIEARDLRGKDSNNLSDPYIVVSCHGSHSGLKSHATRSMCCGIACLCSRTCSSTRMSSSARMFTYRCLMPMLSCATS